MQMITGDSGSKNDRCCRRRTARIVRPLERVSGERGEGGGKGGRGEGLLRLPSALLV